MSEELCRTSALASRHTALGSRLEDWNGMGTAWTYSTDPNDEHDAVRERAGMAAKCAEKVNNVCLDIDHPDMVEGGETLMLDGQNVGTINSPCYSHRMGKSLALAHVQPGLALRTSLCVSGEGLETTATITDSPIYDPDKSRTHS